jgi:hypothetical protein
MMGEQEGTPLAWPTEAAQGPGVELLAEQTGESVDGRAAHLAEARRRRSLRADASPTGTLAELALSTCRTRGRTHSSDQERRQAHASAAADIWGSDGD